MKNWFRTVALPALTTLIASVPAGPAAAITYYDLIVSPPPSTLDRHEQVAGPLTETTGILTATVPFTASDSGPDGLDIVRRAHPRVGPAGIVKSSAEVNAFIPAASCPFGCSASMLSAAFYKTDTFVIQPTPAFVGPVPSAVTASLNFDLSGQLFVFAINSNTTAVADVSVSYFGPLGPLPRDRLVATAHNHVTGSPSSVVSASRGDTPGTPGGIFDVYAQAPSFSETFDIFVNLTNATSPSFLAPVGQPFFFGFGLSNSGGVSNTGGPAAVFGRARSDFGSTLQFASTGPVFNLPDGFTINSVDALITDNRWTGAVTGPAPVPEPATLTLVAGSIISGIAVRWRRRRRSAHLRSAISVTP
jgi:hypothetical protein